MDDTIRIRNKKTGETKVIKRSEANQYGVTPTSPSATKPEMGGVKGTIRNGSELLNMFGLGAVPGAAASAYELPGFVGRGFKPRSLEEAATDNPFLTKQKEHSIEKARTDNMALPKEMLQEGAGLASWAIPLGKGPMLAKMGLSATVGGLNEASQENATPGSIGGSAAISSLFPPAFAVGGKIANRLGKIGKGFISQLFKPAAGDIKDLSKYHKIKFDDEIIKRDLPKITGKSFEELQNYYDDAVKASAGQTDKMLEATGKTVDAREVLRLAFDAQKERSSRVLQGSAMRKISELSDDILRTQFGIDRPMKSFKSAEDLFVYMAKSRRLTSTSGSIPIPLTVANQIKRDIQTVAQSSYNVEGRASPVADSLRGIAAKVNDLIETQAPGAKALNTTEAFYRKAQDLINRRAASASSAEMNALQQFLLYGGLTTTITGLATNNPLLSILGTLPPISVTAARSPKFKTRMAKSLIDMSTKEIPETIKRALTITTGRGAGALSK